MADKTEKTDAYIVIIEWDGKIPPTPYYHRIRAMTGGVRGNKDTSVVTRRASTGDAQVSGIVLQEGVIVTPSKSLARVIAATAERYGAVVVHLGEVSLSPFFGLDDQDKVAMARVDEAYGKRGRPHGPVNWMVSCFEEMKSYYVENKSYVPSCPRCGGFSVSTYPVKAPIRYNYVIEKGGEQSLINYWTVTRFGSGKFILPINPGRTDDVYPENVISSNELHKTPINELKKNVTTVRIKDELDAEIADMIRSSKLASKFDKADVGDQIGDTALFVFDGLFASFRYRSEDERSRQRIKSVMRIMEKGYKGYIRMSEDKNDLDVLDASGVLAPQTMFDMYYMLTDV